MLPSYFPVGSLVLYYGEVKTRPFFIASHRPALGADPGAVRPGCSYLITEKHPLYGHPELEDVIEVFEIDRRMLTIEA